MKYNAITNQIRKNNCIPSRLMLTSIYNIIEVIFFDPLTHNQFLLSFFKILFVTFIQVNHTFTLNFLLKKNTGKEKKLMKKVQI